MKKIFFIRVLFLVCTTNKICFSSYSPYSVVTSLAQKTANALSSTKDSLSTAREKITQDTITDVAEDIVENMMLGLLKIALKGITLGQKACLVAQSKGQHLYQTCFGKKTYEEELEEFAARGRERLQKKIKENLIKIDDSVITPTVEPQKSFLDSLRNFRDAAVKRIKSSLNTGKKAGATMVESTKNTASDLKNKIMPALRALGSKWSFLKKPEAMEKDPSATPPVLQRKKNAASRSPHERGKLLAARMKEQQEAFKNPTL